MNIILCRGTETLRYAAEELQKYLAKVDDIYADIIFDRTQSGITLGLFEDLGLPTDEAVDPFIDDVIDIKVDALKGHIAGSNERSVLMGVYDFLKSAGCRWVRPGADGEYIPHTALGAHAFTYHKKADCPYRGECIEGAIGYEHVRDMIYWMPKVGMNMFMMEQVIPYNYMSRWYQHESSTTRGPENVSFEQVGEYVYLLERHIKKCGMQLHALGHGYLLEPYGVHYKTRAESYFLNERCMRETALVDGKRGLFKKSPNFTQICMSNDEARLGLVKWLADYVDKKPYIDFLHVWLADAVGNHCECENCQKRIPSDFYVQMLNELDEELTARGKDTRVVFIMYTDTFWPPEHEVIKNPKRFVMTTAPIARSYNNTYSDARHDGPLPPYLRNELKLDEISFDMALSFRDAWKKAYDGPRFTYEYYLYTDHYSDPGHMSISEHIHTDIQNLEKAEFDGIMSDQTQRSFFPTGLPMSIIGEVQFDKSVDYNAFADDYFKAAYGADWQSAKTYLTGVTELFDPVTTRASANIVTQDTGTGNGECHVGIRNNKKAGARLRGTDAYVEAFLPVIEKNLTTCIDKCHKKSWELLVYHAEYIKRLAKLYIALSEDDDDTATVVLDNLVDWLSHAEEVIHPQMDLVLCRQRFRQLIKRK